LTKSVDLEFLEKLAPGGFCYGMTCVVEFESNSLWHEVSLAIAAQALGRGMKTEYHVFQHTPTEIRLALKRMGVGVEEFEKKGSFRVMDSYTPTTPLTGPMEGRREPMLSGRTPDVDQWAKAIRDKMKSGFEEEEKRWLHIDDNESVLLQFSDEESIVNGWRTTFVPMAKARELLILHSLVTGIASESFYRKTEAMADAVIDMTTKEEGGRLENYVRLRTLRGVRFDSRWRRIELLSNGEVAVEVAHLEEARRLAAIMFTDMVGYTAMAQTNEAQALDLLRKHRELIRPIVAKHGGSEVKTMGDAFLVEFASALAATECAADIEGALRQYNKSETQRLQVRIGIHVGDVVHQGGDIYGDAVNIASRIEPLAQGGGTCISQQVYDQVRNKLPFRFSKLEVHDLKNVSVPIDVYRLVVLDSDTAALA
jgi:class 3 adenylate cyclase